MKYNILLITVLAVSLSACVDQIQPENTAAEAEKVSINAVIANGGTKTYMGELIEGYGYPVLWSANDKIALISEEISQFTINPKDDSEHTGEGYENATFSGNAAALAGVFPGSKGFPAVYPVDGAWANYSNGKILVGTYLPVKQSYKEGSFDENVFPMSAVSKNGLDYSFLNLCGILHFNIKSTKAGQKIKSIYLSGNNGETVAGGIGMWYDARSCDPVAAVEGDPAWYNGYKVETFGDEAYQRIIMDFGSSPLVFNSAGEQKDIYIAVLPQTFEQGVKLEIVDGSNGGSSFLYGHSATDQSLTIKRGMIKEMTPPVEYETPEPIQIANSYVYSEPGYYLMPAYAMGNRMDLRLDPDNSHPNKAAALLWTDLVDGSGNPLPAVTNIEYMQFDDGCDQLQFKINTNESLITDDNPKGVYRGNAAIALYDKDTKEILWSWHIWMCEEVHDVVTGGKCAAGSYTYSLPDGTSVQFSAEAANGKLVIMDRNLGAISAKPADGWKTYGLHYQNGRRDPFIGAHYNGDYTATPLTTYGDGHKDKLKVRKDETAPFSSATAPTWVNKELAPQGWNYYIGYQTVSAALSHPLTYSTAYELTGHTLSGNGQWTYYLAPNNKEWMDPSLGYTTGIHGNTGLSDGGHQSYWNRTKTIMDPCPVGYSVLGDGGAYFNKDTKTYTGSGTTYGMTTTLSGYSPVWWPAAGCRSVDGCLGSVGYMGVYYFYDHISATHGGHGFYLTITGASAGSNATVTTNHGGSLRCVREKQDTSKYPLK